MKKAFGAILIAVILIVCVVTLTVQRGENYTYTLPESIPNFYFSDTTQGLLLYKGYLYVVTATTSGQTLEIINLKTGTLGGKIYYSQFVKEQISGSAASE